MAYRDGSSFNWDVMAAILLAIPALCLWTLIEVVGGSLAGEGVDGPCGGGFARFLLGVIVIGAGASGTGWLINRLIAFAGRLRRR
ncbi:hypothetical protein SAMN05216382_1482 [Sphingomonas palmae]|uniref:Uncharacterized protein n=1 Tax=Sphingomonas palmae TaxID=1855283 RepID=A0A1H7MFQ6_9SPHN|nr:hypothetical protein [Sphingomonas palmae]SEL10073.1 hypothetical protein SAMN05216382_1482 [Sphingomonas palmae]